MCSPNPSLLILKGPGAEYGSTYSIPSGIIPLETYKVSQRAHEIKLLELWGLAPQETVQRLRIHWLGFRVWSLGLLNP